MNFTQVRHALIVLSGLYCQMRSNQRDGPIFLLLGVGEWPLKMLRRSILIYYRTLAPFTENMFKVVSVSIDGFWKTYKASSTFRDDVNIIIGKNGTGKTTFMNILYAVLAVDLEGLSENSFTGVSIALSDGKRHRTIKARRLESESNPFPFVEYHISNRRYLTPMFGSDEVRTMAPSLRRRAAEETAKIRAELAEIMSIASLSVYRIGSDSDPDSKERASKRYASAVDIRLSSLMQQLTQYQLELSNKAREISSQLQRDVLTSLLYSGKSERLGWRLDFDESVERANLVTAYKQLGVSGPEVSKQIHDHILAASAIAKALKTKSKDVPIDISALEAFSLTQMVVEKSLEAERSTEAIFSQVTLFLETLESFVPEKKFSFAGGELVVSAKGEIKLSRLSSGEKQLLILFIESLLQREKPFVFLADEPELSLHISWQRKIITAIRSLNPNSQIIVATHSPEIAGKFRECILDMEDILHV